MKVRSVDHTTVQSDVVNLEGGTAQFVGAHYPEKVLIAFVSIEHFIFKHWTFDSRSDR